MFLQNQCYLSVSTNLSLTGELILLLTTTCRKRRSVKFSWCVSVHGADNC